MDIVKNKTLFWVILIVLVSILAVLSLHFYLLISKQGYQFRIGGLNIIRLGSPDVFFPAQFEQSFELFNESAPSIHVPRYERNVTFVSESVGEIIAKNIQSGQQDTYSWTDNTHYTCLTPSQVAVPGLNTPVDPAKNLENYKFFSLGNDVGGISDAGFGLLMLRHDVEKDAPVKLTLVSDRPNADGSYNILKAIVFTPHEACVKPMDVKSELDTI